MRRRCTYTVTKRSIRGDQKGEEMYGWLLQFAVSGSLTYYFVETREGEILRLLGSNTSLRLLLEEQQQQQKSSVRKEVADADSNAG